MLIADVSRNEATLSGTVESEALRTKAVDFGQERPSWADSD
jgi:hypothetical protein